MKKILMLFAACALLLPGLALAAGAVVTTLTGMAQVQSGAAAPRALRQGDEVQQGDTIITGRGASVVLKFDDGQIVGMTGDSRMQIRTYQYRPVQRTGSILLSLLRGGMRAITGLIGRNQPSSVHYRAATATIGIRGTDVTIVTDDGGNVVVSVTEGAVTFTYGGTTITIPAGAAAYGADGKITQASAQAIFDRLPPALQEAVNGLIGLTDALNQAGPGSPREGEPSPPPPPTPGSNVPPGNAGGGTSSSR
ncbi:MAG TPA: FecR domain-containing protein [Usitatibacter sp.]|nr:FecR domain-containing protein [Usitatibacter sp.]